MRIVLFGQAAFGEKVAQLILEKGHVNAGIYTTPGIPGKTSPLIELAKKLDIPLYQPRRMRDPEVYFDYVKLKPELNVMAFVTDILPESILKYPPLETIQFHPSLLPRHRGGSAINWAIIKGETRTGITIFYPDRGIDTGPILLQKETEISPDDSVGSLYFNKLFPLGLTALGESIDLIQTGKAPRIPQDESEATCEGLCTEEDAVIDWQKPASQIYNLIRGTNPQPGAHTSFKGKTVKVFDCTIGETFEKETPGKVLRITPDGLAIAAVDRLILVYKVQILGSPKLAAGELAQQLGLKAGDISG